MSEGKALPGSPDGGEGLLDAGDQVRTKRWTGFGVGRSDCRKRAADFSRTARNPRRPVDHYAPELRPVSAKSAQTPPESQHGWAGSPLRKHAAGGKFPVAKIADICRGKATVK